MEKKQLIVSIVAGVVILAVGICLGVIFYANTKTQVQKIQAVSNLSSKIVTSITAYGKVLAINGKEITLSNAGETLKINVADTARVFSFASTTTTITDPKTNKTTTTTSSPVQKTVQFGDIKTGDSVNMILKLLPTGQMQAETIIILPTVK